MAPVDQDTNVDSEDDGDTNPLLSHMRQRPRENVPTGDERSLVMRKLSQLVPRSSDGLSYLTGWICIISLYILYWVVGQRATGTNSDTTPPITYTNGSSVDEVTSAHPEVEVHYGDVYADCSRFHACNNCTVGPILAHHDVADLSYLPALFYACHEFADPAADPVWVTLERVNSALNGLSDEDRALVAWFRDNPFSFRFTWHTGHVGSSSLGAVYNNVSRVRSGNEVYLPDMISALPKLKTHRRNANDASVNYLVDLVVRKKLPYIRSGLSEFPDNGKEKFYVEFGHNMLFGEIYVFLHLFPEQVRVARVRRAREEVLASFMSNPDICAPYKDERWYSVTVCPSDKASIVQLSSDRWKQYKLEEKYMWYVDEVELEWHRLLTAFPRLPIYDVYWAKGVGGTANEKCFENVALNIARFFGLPDLNFQEVKDARHHSSFKTVLKNKHMDPKTTEAEYFAPHEIVYRELLNNDTKAKTWTPVEWYYQAGIVDVATRVFQFEHGIGKADKLTIDDVAQNGNCYA